MDLVSGRLDELSHTVVGPKHIFVSAVDLSVKLQNKANQLFFCKVETDTKNPLKEKLFLSTAAITITRGILNCRVKRSRQSGWK